MFRADNPDATLRDMADAQAPDGSVPSIVPSPNWWGLLDPWWGGACAGWVWWVCKGVGGAGCVAGCVAVMRVGGGAVVWWGCCGRGVAWGEWLWWMVG